MIRVQSEDFVADELMQQLRQAYPQAGALASFVGCVRAEQDDQGILQALQLEHYPGMTEKALAEIVAQARARFEVLSIGVVHRVGELPVSAQIVWVGCVSAHRQASLAAVGFVMDRLKTQAPFWKKAITDTGSYWVAAKASDQQASDAWCD